MHRFGALLLSTSITCCLSGCGTYVPEIQEFWGSPTDTAFKVNAIESQVKCELRQSIQSLLDFDSAKPRSQQRLQFLRNWVAQVTLTLTIIELSALNPGVSLNTPLNNGSVTYRNGAITVPQSSSLGFGGTLSSTATRIDVITAVYDLNEFANTDRKSLTCRAPDYNGTLFLESDLKLDQWMKEALLAQNTEIVSLPAKTDPNANVKNGFLSHEVKFEIVSSGNITPTWKLVRVSTGNGNLPFFNASRDRTQDLLITLGPKATTSKQGEPSAPPALSTAAQNSHLAAQIGAAVATSIRGSQ